VGVLVLMYHFAIEVVPGLHSPWSDFDWHKTVPYLTFLASALAVGKFYKNKQQQYCADFGQQP
jgi:hypothetical protein